MQWSWLLVALLEISWTAGRYSSPAKNVLEYLALLLIGALHECGDAFACRQVRWTAKRIVFGLLGALRMSSLRHGLVQRRGAWRLGR